LLPETANVEIRPTVLRSTFSSYTKENVERRRDHAPNSTFAIAPRTARSPEPSPSMPQLTFADARLPHRDAAVPRDVAAPAGRRRAAHAARNGAALSARHR
jgi:hypothetical protein